MAIKLIEFAKEGSKSIAGLVLDFGFPREEKPAREWFNYLFNATFKTINDLIDELNQMRIELDYLKKNGALPEEPDAGALPGDPVLPPEINPTGTWDVVQLTSPIKTGDFYNDIGNVTYLVKHSSRKQVKDVVMTWIQDIAPFGHNLTKYTSPAKNTDNKGEITFTFKSEERANVHRSATITVTAPNNPLETKVFSLYTFIRSGGGGVEAGGE